MGHRGADAYAADAREHALFMRRVDPALQLIAVGPHTPSDEQWAQQLLARAGNLVDYASLHLYGASLHLGGTDDYEAVVTQPRFFEDQITATADLLAVTARRAGVERPLSIALDEWNMRHLEPAGWPEPQPGARGGTAPRSLPGEVDGAGRLRVNRYSSRTLADALFHAGVLNALHRLCGASIAVRMANTVNLVNANALLEVRPDGLVRSTTYHVWDLYQRRLGRRVVEATVAGCPSTVAVRQGAGGNSGPFRTKPAELPPLDVVATAGEGGVVQLAVINRHRSEAAAARLVRDGRATDLPPAAHAWDLGADTADVWASNSLDAPDQVAVADRGRRELPDGCYEFAPHSVTVLEWAR
jgi:alpha-N-arabinofuranosidase